jgi:ABC-type transport system substrate-binding protein
MTKTQAVGTSTFRRSLVASVLVTLGMLGWSGAGSGAPPHVPRGELRVVDRGPGAWGSIDWNVFDHLVEADKDGNLVPGLASSWRWVDDRTLELKLRERVKFHNGEVFDAEIVKLNWQQYVGRRQPNILGAHMNFKPGSRLDTVNRFTVRLSFPEPDGGALAKLSHMHIANRQFFREFGWGEKRW